MERLDKIISTNTYLTRKEIKELIKKKRIKINETIANSSNIKIDSNKEKILIDDKELIIKKYIYLILNKPKGYVSATTDNKDKTVLDLVPDEYKHRNLFPAGRLDKDTTGLMLITDDGLFAHNILSPKKHIDKKYEVTIDTYLTNEMIEGFKKGVILNDGICHPSNLEIIEPNKGIVTLTEGRYHQIKRMFGCFNAKVIELNRIFMGNLYLPNDLKLGEVRELTIEELNKIKKQD